MGAGKSKESKDPQGQGRSSEETNRNCKTKNRIRISVASASASWDVPEKEEEGGGGGVNAKTDMMKNNVNQRGKQLGELADVTSSLKRGSRAFYNTSQKMVRADEAKKHEQESKNKKKENDEKPTKAVPSILSHPRFVVPNIGVAASSASTTARPTAATDASAAKDDSTQTKSPSWWKRKFQSKK